MLYQLLCLLSEAKLTQKKSGECPLFFLGLNKSLQHHDESMKILFIHGMNQQNYSAETLREFWLQVFQTGINRLNIDLDVHDLDIVLPFYGDLLTKHKLNNTLDLGTFLPKSWSNIKLPFSFRNNPTIVQDKNPCITPLPCAEDIEPKTLTQRLALVSSLAKDRALRELSIFLNHYPKLHDSLIQKFLIETYLYLSNPEFMDEVHERIMQNLDPHEDYLIVSHSLGTVIAYNLLHKNKLCRINRLITLGSPLAFKVIQERLAPPICRPKHFLGDWINFYSPNDFLTAFPLTEPPFDFKPEIENFAIQTLISNPHRIIGYLANPLVIESILQSLKVKTA